MEAFRNCIKLLPRCQTRIADPGHCGYVNNYITLLLFASLLPALIKGHSRWWRNLTVVLTISIFLSLLSTNTMRIPTTAEFFTFFAATGQLSGLSRQRKIVIVYFLWPVCGWHTSIAISYSGRWLGILSSTILRTISYSQTWWYLQYSRYTKRRPHVSTSIHHICTFYLCIKIQLPDHMPKRPDRWQVQQSHYWRCEICSLTSASHILTKTIIVGDLPCTLVYKLLANSCPWMG